MIRARAALLFLVPVFSMLMVAGSAFAQTGASKAADEMCYMGKQYAYNCDWPLTKKVNGIDIQCMRGALCFDKNIVTGICTKALFCEGKKCQIDGRLQDCAKADVEVKEGGQPAPQQSSPPASEDVQTETTPLPPRDSSVLDKVLGGDETAAQPPAGSPAERVNDAFKDLLGPSPQHALPGSETPGAGGMPMDSDWVKLEPKGFPEGPVEPPVGLPAQSPVNPEPRLFPPSDLTSAQSRWCGSWCGPVDSVYNAGAATVDYASNALSSAAQATMNGLSAAGDAIGGAIGDAVDWLGPTATLPPDEIIVGSDIPADTPGIPVVGVSIEVDTQSVPLQDGEPPTASGLQGPSALAIREQLDEMRDNIIEPTAEKISAAGESLASARAELERAEAARQAFVDRNAVDVDRDGNITFGTQEDLDAYKSLNSRFDQALTAYQGQAATLDVMRAEFADRAAEYRTLAETYDNLPASTKLFGGYDSRTDTGYGLEGQKVFAEGAKYDAGTRLQQLEDQYKARTFAEMFTGDNIRDSLEAQHQRQLIQDADKLVAQVERVQTCMVNCTFANDAARVLMDPTAPATLRNAVASTIDKWGSINESLGVTKGLLDGSPNDFFLQNEYRIQQDSLSKTNDLLGRLSGALPPNEASQSILRTANLEFKFPTSFADIGNDLKWAAHKWVGTLGTIAGMGLGDATKSFTNLFVEDPALRNGLTSTLNGTSIPLFSPVAALGAGALLPAYNVVGIPTLDQQLRAATQPDSWNTVQYGLDAAITTANFAALGGFSAVNRIVAEGSFYASQGIAGRFFNELAAVMPGVETSARFVPEAITSRFGAEVLPVIRLSEAPATAFETGVAARTLEPLAANRAPVVYNPSNVSSGNIIASTEQRVAQELNASYARAGIPSTELPAWAKARLGIVDAEAIGERAGIQPRSVIAEPFPRASLVESPSIPKATLNSTAAARPQVAPALSGESVGTGPRVALLDRPFQVPPVELRVAPTSDVPAVQAPPISAPQKGFLDTMREYVFGPKTPQPSIAPLSPLETQAIRDFNSALSAYDRATPLYTSQAAALVTDTYRGLGDAGLMQRADGAIARADTGDVVARRMAIINPEYGPYGISAPLEEAVRANVAEAAFVGPVPTFSTGGEGLGATPTESPVIRVVSDPFSAARMPSPLYITTDAADITTRPLSDGRFVVREGASDTQYVVDAAGLPALLQRLSGSPVPLQAVPVPKLSEQLMKATRAVAAAIPLSVLPPTITTVSSFAIDAANSQLQAKPAQIAETTGKPLTTPMAIFIPKDGLQMSPEARGAAPSGAATAPATIAPAAQKSTPRLTSTYGWGSGSGDAPCQNLAGGGRLCDNPWTMANNSDPIGTKYRVTNPSTGRSAVLEVKDRGPFLKRADGTYVPHPTRWADVGKQAAEALGMGKTVKTLQYEKVPTSVALGPQTGPTLVQQLAKIPEQILSSAQNLARSPNDAATQLASKGIEAGKTWTQIAADIKLAPNLRGQKLADSTYYKTVVRENVAHEVAGTVGEASAADLAKADAAVSKLVAAHTAAAALQKRLVQQKVAPKGTTVTLQDDGTYAIAAQDGTPYALQIVEPPRVVPVVLEAEKRYSLATLRGITDPKLRPFVQASARLPSDRFATGKLLAASIPVLAEYSARFNTLPQITSLGRSTAANSAVGGARNSDHLAGNALDFNTTRESAARRQGLISILERNDFYLITESHGQGPHTHASLRRSVTADEMKNIAYTTEVPAQYVLVTPSGQRAGDAFALATVASDAIAARTLAAMAPSAPAPVLAEVPAETQPKPFQVAAEELPSWDVLAIAPEAAASDWAAMAEGIERFNTGEGAAPVIAAVQPEAALADAGVTPPVRLASTERAPLQYNALSDQLLRDADTAIQNEWLERLRQKGYSVEVRVNPNGIFYQQTRKWEQPVAPVVGGVSHVTQTTKGLAADVAAASHIDTRPAFGTATYGAHVYVGNCSSGKCPVVVAAPFSQRVNHVSARPQLRPKEAPELYSWNTLAVEISAPNERAVTQAAAQTVGEVFRTFGEVSGQPNFSQSVYAHHLVNYKSPGEGQKAMLATRSVSQDAAYQPRWEISSTRLAEAPSTSAPAPAASAEPAPTIVATAETAVPTVSAPEIPTVASPQSPPQVVANGPTLVEQNEAEVALLEKRMARNDEQIAALREQIQQARREQSRAQTNLNAARTRLQHAENALAAVKAGQANVDTAQYGLATFRVVVWKSVGSMGGYQPTQREKDAIAAGVSAAASLNTSVRSMANGGALSVELSAYLKSIAALEKKPNLAGANQVSDLGTALVPRARSFLASAERAATRAVQASRAQVASADRQLTSTRDTAQRLAQDVVTLQNANAQLAMELGAEQRELAQARAAQESAIAIAEAMEGQQTASQAIVQLEEQPTRFVEVPDEQPILAQNADEPSAVLASAPPESAVPPQSPAPSETAVQPQGGGKPTSAAEMARTARRTDEPQEPATPLTPLPRDRSLVPVEPVRGNVSTSEPPSPIYVNSRGDAYLWNPGPLLLPPPSAPIATAPRGNPNTATPPDVIALPYQPAPGLPVPYAGELTAAPRTLGNPNRATPPDVIALTDQTQGGSSVAPGAAPTTPTVPTTPGSTAAARPTTPPAGVAPTPTGTGAPTVNRFATGPKLTQPLPSTGGGATGGGGGSGTTGGGGGGGPWGSPSTGGSIWSGVKTGVKLTAAFGIGGIIVGGISDLFRTGEQLVSAINEPPKTDDGKTEDKRAAALAQQKKDAEREQELIEKGFVQVRCDAPQSDFAQCAFPINGACYCQPKGAEEPKAGTDEARKRQLLAAGYVEVPENYPPGNCEAYDSVGDSIYCKKVAGAAVPGVPAPRPCGANETPASSGCVQVAPGTTPPVQPPPPSRAPAVVGRPADNTGKVAPPPRIREPFSPPSAVPPPSRTRDPYAPPTYDPSGQVLTSNYYCMTSAEPIVVVPLSAGSRFPSNCYNAPPNSSQAQWSNFAQSLQQFLNRSQQSSSAQPSGSTAVGTERGASPTQPTVQPAVTLVVNPSSIPEGSSATLSWSSVGASSCAIAGSNGSSFPAVKGSGSQTTGALSTSTVFTVTCTTGSGATVRHEAAVTVH